MSQECVKTQEDWQYVVAHASDGNLLHHDAPKSNQSCKLSWQNKHEIKTNMCVYIYILKLAQTQYLKVEALSKAFPDMRGSFNSCIV